MPKIRPTGYWTKSVRHRISWALSQALAHREDARRRREAAKWQSRLQRGIDKALARVDWKAWAKRRMVAKELSFKPAYDFDDIPGLDLGDVENMVRDLYRDAGRKGWRPPGVDQGGVALQFPAAEFEAAMAMTFAQIKGITDTMQSRMQSIMRETMDRSENFEQFGRNLRKEFAHLSAERARVIAVHEYARAASETTQLLAEAQGVTGKQANNVGDENVCDECLANSAQGIIRLRDDFQSGHRSPPFHVGCRCNQSDENYGE